MRDTWLLAAVASSSSLRLPFGGEGSSLLVCTIYVAFFIEIAACLPWLA
jgi:hypothetical protein